MWFAFLIVAFIALSLLIGLLFYLMDEPAQCLIRCDPNMQRTYCTCGADAHNLAISNALGEGTK